MTCGAARSASLTSFATTPVTRASQTTASRGTALLSARLWPAAKRRAGSDNLKRSNCHSPLHKPSVPSFSRCKDSVPLAHFRGGQLWPECVCVCARARARFGGSTTTRPTVTVVPKSSQAPPPPTHNTSGVQFSVFAEHACMCAWLSTST